MKLDESKKAIDNYTKYIIYHMHLRIFLLVLITVSLVTTSMPSKAMEPLKKLSIGDITVAYPKSAKVPASQIAAMLSDSMPTYDSVLSKIEKSYLTPEMAKRLSKMIVGAEHRKTTDDAVAAFKKLVSSYSYAMHNIVLVRESDLGVRGKYTSGRITVAYNAVEDSYEYFPDYSTNIDVNNDNGKKFSLPILIENDVKWSPIFGQYIRQQLLCLIQILQDSDTLGRNACAACYRILRYTRRFPFLLPALS